MFAEYDSTERSVSLKISEKISPDSVRIKSVRQIYDFLGPRSVGPTTTHITVGKYVEFKNGKPQLTKAVDLELNVFGRQIPPLPVPVSPREDRVAQFKALELDRRLFEKGGDERVTTPPEAMKRLQKVIELNEFPSWSSFFSGLKQKAKELDDSQPAKQLIDELAELWVVWNSDYAASYSDTGESAYFHRKHVVYGGWPPWRQYRNYRFNSAVELNTHLYLHLEIISDFFSKFAGKLLFGWKEYFAQQNHVNLLALKSDVDNFLRKATDISRVDWPLEICELLLRRASSWVANLVDDNLSKKFFNSIASVQALLIDRVRVENITSFVYHLTAYSDANHRIIVPISSIDIDRSALFDVTVQFSTITEEIVRIEHRMYPDIYSEKKFLKLEKHYEPGWQRLVFNVENPFAGISDQIEELRAGVEELVESQVMETGSYIEKINTLHELLRTLGRTPRKIIDDTFIFDFTSFADYLTERLGLLRDSITNRVNEIISIESKVVTDFYHKCSKKLYGQDAFHQLQNLASVNSSDIPVLKSLFETMHASCAPYLHHFPITELTLLRYCQAARAHWRLSNLAELIWEKLQADRAYIEKAVIENSSAVFFESEMIERELKLTIKKYKLYQTSLNVRQMATRFHEMHEVLSNLSAQFPVLNNQLELLGLEPINIDIPALEQLCRIFARVSEVNVQTLQFEDSYLNAKIQDVDCREASDQLDELKDNFAVVGEMVGELVGEDSFAADTTTQLIKGIEKSVTVFSDTMPLVKALRSEGMKQRHWQNMLLEENVSREMRDKLLVKDLITLDIGQKAEKCEEISVVASKELQVEISLEKMKQQWAEWRNATPESAANTHRFTAPNEVQIVLEEHIIKTQMTLSSPYSAAFADDLNAWLATLQSLQIVFERYHFCESKLVYIEPLFTTEDIAYQMPEEWRMYQIATEQWQAIHNKMVSAERYIDLGGMGIEEEINAVLARFMKIQVGFDAYLQKRKLNSPRLHFLSNTELLEMLSKAKNPELVQPYLPKLFAAIHRLEFNHRGEIVAAFAADGEKLVLRRPVNVTLAKRHVDKWLFELEREMRATIQADIESVLQSFRLAPVDVERVLAKGFTAQVTLLYYKVVFTKIIEDGISRHTLLSVAAELDVLAKSAARFTPVTARDRIVLDNLLIDIFHAKETVQHLVAVDCQSIEHAAWKATFRYYWSCDNLFVRLFNYSILYGYEYLAAKKPFVRTPAVKNLFLQFAVFQQQRFAVLLQGPAATGKSETIKEFARNLGRHCISFNCSNQVTLVQLEDLVAGSLLSGLVLCLDEFNRLQPPVMVATVNHFLGVYQAMQTASWHYRLREHDLTVNPFTAFFLSMNPAYVNRNPLPSNTTTVAKIIDVPWADLGGIAQEYLLLAKFKFAKRCAGQLTSTLRQTAATVAPMRHYDFSLRTLLATVHAAIYYKDLLALFTEGVITAKAAQHSLRPIFTDVDAKAFAKVMSVGKNKPPVTDAEGAYRSAIEGICKRLKLVLTEKFVNACYYIYSLSRHSCAIALLGPSLTGKTTALRVVRELLREKDDVTGRISDIVPNLHDSESLFGFFDTQKLEWERGVLTKSLLETMPDTGSEHWIHFDGVVDSLWVESLNSLLDDNRKLCLGNGETVFLAQNTRIVFETNSLAKVALSTISRCRVVYFDESTLPPEAQGAGYDPSVLKTICDVASTPFDTAIGLQRVVELYRLHDAFPRNDAALAHMLGSLAAASIASRDAFAFDPDVFFSFPQAFGQWMDLSAQARPHVRFWRMFFQRLFRSPLMLVVFGESGTGKTLYIHELMGHLNDQNWDVHVISLSETTTADSLLQAILDCNLIRISANHFTSPNAKETLIILDGLARLPTDLSFECPFELLRSLHASGQVTNRTGEQLTFTSVHFIAEYSTRESDPTKLKLPVRLQRYIYPWHWVSEENYRNPANACRAFLRLFCPEEPANGDDEAAVNEGAPDYTPYAVNELRLAYGGLPDDSFFFGPYAAVLADLRASTATPVPLGTYLHSLKGDNFWQVDSLFTAQSLLIKSLNKNSRRPPGLTTTVIHDYNVRHFLFLSKVLAMPRDGHCLLIGSSRSVLNPVCTLLAHVLDLHLDELPIELTELRWKETLIQIARHCAIENRKILLLVSGDIYDKRVFRTVLADLVVIMNCGALPTALFSSQFMAELRGSSKIGGETTGEQLRSLSDWKQKEKVANAIRANLHVFLRVDAATMEQHRVQFSQIVNYVLVDNLDRWTDAELLSFGQVELQASGEVAAHQCELKAHKLLQLTHAARAEHPHRDIPAVAYVSLVREYIHQVHEKRLSIETLERRYKTGIDKLIKANEQMSFLQQELLRLQPELVRTSLETTVLMSTIERETIEIENAREVVAANESKANEAATRAQALKVECEQELAEAIPALEMAIDALQILNQSDISTLKSMRFPPNGVRLCMEAVCILLGEKPAKSTDQLGNVSYDYWAVSQKVLSDIHFLHRIRTFARDQVSNKTMRLIRTQYLSKEEFDSENMKQASLAAEGLCLWVKALDVYNKIAKVVRPKKDKLRNAELMVKQHMKQLDQRRKALQDVTERLQRLSDQFSHMSQRKQDLQTQIQSCEARMGRANKLLQALGNERERWVTNLARLDATMVEFHQSAMLSSVATELLSDFDVDIRTARIRRLADVVNLRQDDFSLRSMLRHTSVLAGGEADVAMEPFVLLELTHKVPLIVDPQGESQRTLAHICSTTLTVIDAHSTALAQAVVEAVGKGHVLVVDKLRPPVPLLLFQLVKPQISEEGKKRFIQLSDKAFQIHEDFRVILRVENAELSVFADADLLQHVCVINVAYGHDAILEKLMDIFVEVNVCSLFLKRETLLSEKAKMLRDVDSMEDLLLDALSKSKDLDDDRSIDMLAEVHKLSGSMNRKLADLTEVEGQLNELKKKYKRVGEHGARLVNAALCIGGISPFYKRTLRFHLDVFRSSVAPMGSTLSETSVEKFMTNVTGAYRQRFARSLFPQHRRAFNFLSTGKVSISRLSSLKFEKFAALYAALPPEEPSNLRDQILYADCNLPIVLLLSAETDYVMRMLFALAESMLVSRGTTARSRAAAAADQTAALFVGQPKVRIVAAHNLLSFNWQACLEHEQWLIVQNCENLAAEEMDGLTEVAREVFTSDTRKAGFKMFFIIYPEGEMASHSLLDFSTVITIDDSHFKFKSFILYCYNSLTPSRLHPTFKNPWQAEILYKLCCFHFVVAERSRYGIYGFASPLRVSIGNLECAIRLMESAQLGVAQRSSFEEVWTAALRIAYSTADAYNVATLKVVGQWVFEGVNRFDDRMRDAMLLPEYGETVSLIKMAVHDLPDANGPELSGLSTAVTREYAKHALIDIYAAIRDLHGTTVAPLLPSVEVVINEPATWPEKVDAMRRCIVNEIHFLRSTGLFPDRCEFLEDIVRQPVVPAFPLYFLARPEAILETLKFQFVRRYRVMYDEVDVVGTLRRQKDNADSLEISDCYLTGAQYEPRGNLIVESEQAFQRLESLFIVVRRRAVKTATSISLPLFYQPSFGTSREWTFVVNVEVETVLPETHWQLRGVKFISAADWASRGT